MRMRKKRRSAERLSALSSLFCQYITDSYIKCDNVFDKNQPIRLEIGCGKGDFIKELSVAEAGYNYFALEKVADVIVVAAEKYASSRGLGKLSPHGLWTGPDGHIYEDEIWDIPLGMRGNVRFINADAENLDKMFEEGSVSDIFANFSDPWTKNGQADRRLTAPRFLETYYKLLKPGGTFRFKTDNVQLFDYSLETVKASKLELGFYTRDLHASEKNEGNIQTEYERNFSAKGIKINYLEAVKKG